MSNTLIKSKVLIGFGAVLLIVGVLGLRLFVFDRSDTNTVKASDEVALGPSPVESSENLFCTLGPGNCGCYLYQGSCSDYVGIASCPGGAVIYDIRNYFASVYANGRQKFGGWSDGGDTGCLTSPPVSNCWTCQ